MMTFTTRRDDQSAFGAKNRVLVRNSSMCVARVGKAIRCMGKHGTDCGNAWESAQIRRIPSNRAIFSIDSQVGAVERIENILLEPCILRKLWEIAGHFGRAYSDAIYSVLFPSAYYLSD